MNKLYIIPLLLFTLSFNVSSAYSSNVLLGIGDSITYGVRTGVTTSDTFIYQTSQELQGEGYTSIGYDNNGIGGGCLTNGGGCSSRSPVIDRYNTDLVSVNPRISYLLPNINDLIYNHVPSEYEEDFNTIMDTTLNANIPIVTSTFTGLSHDLVVSTYDYVGFREPVYNAFIREYAIINEIPFFEAGYLINQNGSYMVDQLHLNTLGHDLITDALLNAIINDTVMSLDNYNYYDDCNTTITLFNYSIKNSLSCSLYSSSAEWNIFTNMNNNHFYTERLDGNAQINLTAVNNDEYFYIEDDKNTTEILTVSDNKIVINVTKEKADYYYKKLGVEGLNSACWVCGDWLACLDNKDGGSSILNRPEIFKCSAGYPVIRSGESGLIRNMSLNVNNYYNSDVGVLNEI